MLTRFLGLIYCLATGVTPHTLDLLACLGVVTLLLGGLAAVLLACELAVRAARPLVRRTRVRRELKALEDGTCDGLSKRERAVLAQKIAEEIREDI